MKELKAIVYLGLSLVVVTLVASYCFLNSKTNVLTTKSGSKRKFYHYKKKDSSQAQNDSHPKHYNLVMTTLVVEFHTF